MEDFRDLLKDSKCNHPANVGVFHQHSRFNIHDSSKNTTVLFVGDPAHARAKHNKGR